MSETGSDPTYSTTGPSERRSRALGRGPGTRRDPQAAHRFRAPSDLVAPLHAGDAGIGDAGSLVAARELQQARQGKPNARLSPKELERHCATDRPARKLLDAALGRLSLSARAYHRVIKVARTIADLDGRDTIAATHVAQAVRFRDLDRAAPP